MEKRESLAYQRLKAIIVELERTIELITVSPKVFDVFVSSGGNEDQGYYFSLNAIPNERKTP